MNRIQITPQAYHSQLVFDPQKLPDLSAAGHVSASALCAARDPLSFLFGQPKKQTKAMEWGNLVDCRWLTPELFNSTYIVLPEDAPQKPTKAMLEAKKPGADSIARQEWWANWERKSEGLISVKATVMQEVDSAVSMLSQNKLAEHIRETSDCQVALAGPNPLGFPGMAKCLIDLFPTEGHFHGSVVDLKSTNDITDRGIKNTIWTFQYHVKMAFYGLLLEAAGLGPINRHILIWQRSKFPYDVHVREIDPEDIAVGTKIIHKRFREMLAMNPLDVSNLFDEEVRMVPLDQWQRDQEPGVDSDNNEEEED